MRRRTAAVALAAVCWLALVHTSAGGVVARAAGPVVDPVGDAARSLFAPAYDATTQVSVRALAVALQSRSLSEGTLDGVTAEELAAWGWEAPATAEVRIEVGGPDFRAVVVDLRPGATSYELVSTGGASVDLGVADDPPRTGTPGVTVVPLG